MACAEHAVEQFVEVGHHVGDGAEHAARRRRRAAPAPSNQAASRAASMPNRQAACSSMRPRQRSRISSNTGQEISSCGATRIEMGAHRLGAVGVGAAQREIHAARDVVGVPARGAVLAGGIERAHEGAVGIGLARPDMALVDMGVAVDEAGQHDAAGEVDRRAAAAGLSPRAAMPVILPSATAMSASAKPSAVEGGGRGRASASACTRALASMYQPDRGNFDDGHGKAAVSSEHHRSCFSALSCQRRRMRCETSVSTRKITMPVTRDQDQRREQPRRVEPVAGLDDARGEARRLARRAGDELGHHGADQRQAAGDLQAAEEIRHRRRQPQLPELLPARRAVELEQVDADCGRPSSGRAWCWRGSGRRRRSRRTAGASPSGCRHRC